MANIDIFVSTVDPMKEPPLITANTVLSILAVDYPVDKVACYVSDDGAAMLTFEALSETSEFARKWVPFCKKYKIEPRAPEWYFVQKVDYLKDKVDPTFIRERRAMKVWMLFLRLFVSLVQWLSNLMCNDMHEILPRVMRIGNWFDIIFLEFILEDTSSFDVILLFWCRETMRSLKFGSMDWLPRQRRSLKRVGRCRMELHGPETMSGIIPAWSRQVVLAPSKII